MSRRVDHFYLSRRAINDIISVQAPGSRFSSLPDSLILILPLSIRSLSIGQICPNLGFLVALVFHPSLHFRHYSCFFHLGNSVYSCRIAGSTLRPRNFSGFHFTPKFYFGLFLSRDLSALRLFVNLVNRLIQTVIVSSSLIRPISYFLFHTAGIFIWFYFFI